MSEFIQKYTSATGCYIGKLQYPEKEISEDADDNAHFDAEAPQVVKFIHASKDHEYIVGRTLQPDEGLTHDVFKEHSQAAPEEAEEGAEGDDPVAKKPMNIEDTFKHVYVKEVVREPRMHFQ